MHRLMTRLILASIMIGWAGWAPVIEAKPVTFAYNTPTLSGTLPIVVAQDFGFFAAEGLEVKTVFIRGGPTAMAALVGGGVDYIFVAGVAAVRAIAQNAPMIIISGMQPYMDYTLIGAKGITGVDDLKGKMVGVTGPGGVAEFAAVEGLAKKGLVRDRDYKILYGVGNSPARAQALETGKIQASPFSFLERLELEKKASRSSSTLAASCPVSHSWSLCPANKKLNPILRALSRSCGPSIVGWISSRRIPTKSQTS
jgi:NitT/TauT family transport system substrate-binding protein